MSDNLFASRHSLAHITAAAVEELWPDAKFGVGPVVENGFYYDIDLGSTKISEDDFEKIEAKMRQIIEQAHPFERSEAPIDEAIAWAEESDQTYKRELLSDLKRAGTTVFSELDTDELGLDGGSNGVDKVSFYKSGDFVDLCRGPHVSDTSAVGAFKLVKVAGAYWRGDESRPQMQRLYGVAFDTQEELDQYLTSVEEAKKRDHRKLGKELDLYTTSNMVGPGLPLFTPRGTVLRELLADYSNQLRQEFGFEKIWTPHITKIDLYKKSGHWDKFGDELLLVKSQETSDEFVMKPMNCPHHTQIFDSSPRSYKDLPIRYLDTTTVYRDEKTGELGGLSRVRSITQDDSHVFCTEEQIGEEIANLLKAAQDLYSSIDMDLRVRLSYRDEGEGYLGDQSLWESAQSQLKTVVVASGMEFFEESGEAAFYGPKIDFMAMDALGREHQVATVQLDFVLPRRFELGYIDSDGSSKPPVMIHSALLGSIERFLSVFIEHTGGVFPFWIAPEQVRIITISDSVDDYVDEITKVLRKIRLDKPVENNKLRFGVDNKNGSVSKKIKSAIGLKVPIQFIVGPRDKDSREISVRTNEGETKISFDEIENYILSQG
jgi:threonyl-tRNA synthetase